MQSFFFFFQNATNPSFFFMLVYVIKKDISNGSRTRVSGAGGGRSNKEHQRLQVLQHLFVRFTHRLYWYTHLLLWHPTVGINATPENLLFLLFLWFSLSSLRFLPPGVGLTGSSRPSKVLLEFKALIVKTEHKQTRQSVVMLDCIERILIDREDISHLG